MLLDDDLQTESIPLSADERDELRQMSVSRSLPAGVDVTRKAVQRYAEASGSDIETRQQTAIQRAIQLDLRDIAESDIPVLYIEWMAPACRSPQPRPKVGKAGAERNPAARGK